MQVSLICLFLSIHYYQFLHYVILLFIFLNCTPVMHWYVSEIKLGSIAFTAKSSHHFYEGERLHPQIGKNRGKPYLFIPFIHYYNFFTLYNLQFIFVNCTPVMHWYLLQWSNRVPLLWRQNQVITFMKVKDSSHGLA